MIGYQLEYKVGNVSLIPSNILVSDIDDMELLEFWEERLQILAQPFAILYREDKDGFVKYSILTEMKKKGNPFR